MRCLGGLNDGTSLGVVEAPEYRTKNRFQNTGMLGLINEE